MKSTIKRCFAYAAFSLTALVGANIASATIVQFQTSLGNFEVNLYDSATPETVDNFLAYVNDESYKETIIHRSQPKFVIQGGGFKVDIENKRFIEVPKKAPVTNEPVYSNVRGTIAMAKLSGNINSATSQWFFNLSDNSFLDSPDRAGGGLFTAFGEVVGSGMDVVDAIATLPIFGLTSGAFQTVPLRDYTIDDGKNNVAITAENYVTIENILVIDANKDTAASLKPAMADPKPLPTPPPATDSGGGGGGALGFGIPLCLLLLICANRRKYQP